MPSQTLHREPRLISTRPMPMAFRTTPPRWSMAAKGMTQPWPRPSAVEAASRARSSSSRPRSSGASRSPGPAMSWGKTAWPAQITGLTETVWASG
ncbi:MAG: hypothetical protein II132_08335, partial [Desulfovibrio sp.]|nr:hypothetical protein [Desulfovibrio sp.]